MRVLGFLFLSLLAATLLLFVDYYLPGTYLADFLNNHFIETLAALVGFNIAAVIFLVGQLMNLENKLSVKTAFEKTRKEIKHNSYFLLSSLPVCLFLLIIRPTSQGGGLRGDALYYLDSLLVLTIFCLVIFAIYEILYAVFLLGRNDPS